MGIVEGIAGDLFEAVNLFQSLVWIILIGGFVYFMFAKFWWKEDPKPVEPAPPAEGTTKDAEESGKATGPGDSGTTASDSKGGVK